MTDRKKLEWALSYYVVGSRHHLGMNSAEFETIYEAAESWLASLPKPMWKVRVWAGPTELYEFHEWPTQQEALIDVSGHLARGVRKVEIEAP